MSKAAVTNALTTNGVLDTVTLPVGAASQFFRLKSQWTVGPSAPEDIPEEGGAKTPSAPSAEGEASADSRSRGRDRAAAYGVLITR